MEDFEIVKRELSMECWAFLKDPLESSDHKKYVTLTKLFYNSVETDINLQKMDNNTNDNNINDSRPW